MSRMSRSTWGLTASTDDWRTRAACGPDTAHLFDPPTGPARLTPDNRKAIRLCRQCPVLADCLEHERANPDPNTRIAAGRIWRGGKEETP